MRSEALPRPSVEEAIGRSLVYGIVECGLIWLVWTILGFAGQSDGMEHHHMTQFVLWTGFVYGMGAYAALRRTA